MRLILKSALTVVALTAASLLIATPAHADTASIEYEITSADLSVNTWPGATGECNTDQKWWAMTSKFYIEKQLRVSESGIYTFTDLRSPGFTEKAAMVILTGNLDPDDVSNCVYSINESAQVELQEGVTYTLALAGFHRDAMGTFSYQAQGPGAITIGNPSESELIVDSVAADTDTQIVLAAAPVSNLLGVDLSGTVTFLLDGEIIGNAAVDGSTGEASIAIGKLPIGTYAIIANYSGVPAKTLSSSGSATLTVSATQTTTTLDISPEEIVDGAQATYTATVSGLHPSGNVEFYNGATLVGISPVIGGVASVTVSPSAGTYNITAYYFGDSNYTASNSQLKTLLVKRYVQPDPKPEPNSKNPAGTSLANTGSESSNLSLPIVAAMALASGLVLLVTRRKAIK